MPAVPPAVRERLVEVKLAVTPEGRPVTVRLTWAAKLLMLLSVKTVVGLTVDRVVSLDVMLKSGAAGGAPGAAAAAWTLRVIVVVLVVEPLVPVTVSV